MDGLKYQFKKFDNAKLETGAGLPTPKTEKKKSDDEEIEEILNDEYVPDGSHLKKAGQIIVKFGNAMLGDEKIYGSPGTNGAGGAGGVGYARMFDGDEDLVASTTSANPDYGDLRHNMSKFELIKIIDKQDKIIDNLMCQLERIHRPTYSPSPSKSCSVSPSPTSSPSVSPSPSW